MQLCLQMLGLLLISTIPVVGTQGQIASRIDDSTLPVFLSTVAFDPSTYRSIRDLCKVCLATGQQAFS